VAQSVEKAKVFGLLSLASQPVKTSRRVSKRRDGCTGKKTHPSKSANTLAKQRGKSHEPTV
jgi:ribosomal protein L3